jgi:amino-acid N-acetyltransferase
MAQHHACGFGDPAMSVVATTKAKSSKSERIRIFVDKATLHDVSGILAVLMANKKDPQLFQRKRADIQRHIRDFMVATDEKGKLLGCVALHFHTSTVAEILSLAVAPGCQGKGIGPRLMEAAENMAVDRHAETTWLVCHKTDYFERLGYSIIARRKLPPGTLLAKFRQVLEQSPSRWLSDLWKMKFMVRHHEDRDQ